MSSGNYQHNGIARAMLLSTYLIRGLPLQPLPGLYRQVEDYVSQMLCFQTFDWVVEHSVRSVCRQTHRADGAVDLRTLQCSYHPHCAAPQSLVRASACHKKVPLMCSVHTDECRYNVISPRHKDHMQLWFFACGSPSTLLGVVRRHHGGCHVCSKDHWIYCQALILRTCIQHFTHRLAKDFPQIPHGNGFSLVSALRYICARHFVDWFTYVYGSGAPDGLTECMSFCKFHIRTDRRTY